MGERTRQHAPVVLHGAVIADRHEAVLLARFTAHDLFAGIDRLGHDAFIDVLLQRRFLSLLFSVIYDIGIDGLRDPTARRLAREILREEYPDATGNARSHREELVADLRVLGATRTRVLTARPTAATSAAVEETLALMLDAASSADDVEVLTILRFWGEVVVSVEYGEFWPRMAGSFLAAGTDSRFYAPHHHHDGREPLATASASSPTHSGRLGACLATRLTDDDTLAAFARVEAQVIDGRMRFYDQFLGSAR